MKTRTLILGLLAAVAPLIAVADAFLQLPGGAKRGFESLDNRATMQMAVGPFGDGRVQSVSVEGEILRQVWQIPIADMATLDVLKPLRQQLEGAGFAVLYECETRGCGGFDFRFGIDVADEPQMHVDLGDFRYLSASREEGEQTEYLTLLVSRSPDRGFVQITRVAPELPVDSQATLSTKSQPSSPDSEPALGFVEQLLSTGVVVLDGLEFLKGSSNLSGNSSTSLLELSDLLKSDPTMTVVLVGHTDASGSLKANIALSQRRANSVLKKLVDVFGVDPEQISAEGVGYLSPRASNATIEGRERNRRVEVVLVTAQKSQ